MTGCAIKEKIVEIAIGDTARTAELAAKYGKPEVQRCAEFLHSSLTAMGDRQKLIDALRAEPTAGLLSKAFKALLIAELNKDLGDTAKKEFIRGFETNCATARADILLTILEVRR